MAICLEGPDEVGKSTIASLLGGPGEKLPGNAVSGVYDRSWVTDYVYRLAIPTHDWSEFQIQAPFAAANVDLVVILPGDKLTFDFMEKPCREHGYSPADYQRVNYTYMSAYDMLAMSVRLRSRLFKSVSLLQWEEGELRIVKASSAYHNATSPAQAVIEAAKQYKANNNN